MSIALKNRIGRFWREWLRALLLTVLAVTTFRSAVADWNDVPTGSMKPTILEGDRIVVNKLAYDLKVPYTTRRLVSWDDPARGDIVVLLSPADGLRLVKRVVGLPGDTIAMHDNQLVVNNQRVGYRALETVGVGLAETPSGRVLAREDLGASGHRVMITPGCSSLRSFEETVVPAGSYFVMGDNRDQSLDSRYFGVVSRNRILGQATAVAASVDPAHRYLPRWKRFFTALD